MYRVAYSFEVTMATNKNDNKYKSLTEKFKLYDQEV